MHTNANEEKIMSDAQSPYESYDDAVNAERDAEGAKHRKDEGADAGVNETLESLKAAGTSALGGAEEFTSRRREERAAHADSKEQAASTAASDDSKPGSCCERATGRAKDRGGSARRAAEETRDAEAFNEAKEKAGSSFG